MSTVVKPLSTIIEELSSPLRADEVEFAVKRTNQDKTRAMLQPHIQAQSVIRRLNAVCPGQWSVAYYPLDDRRINCTISIWDGVATVSRSGIGAAGAGGSTADPFKTAESDSIKRSARHYGIGLELWDWEEVWVPCTVEYGQTKITAKHEEILIRSSKGRFSQDTSDVQNAWNNFESLAPNEDAPSAATTATSGSAMDKLSKLRK